MKPVVLERPLFVDDRGMVYGAFDEMDRSNIKRTYVIENHGKGLVRAWHAHKNGDTYMHVISGSAKLGALKLDLSESFFCTLSYRKPSLLFVPRGWANGSMSLEENTKILVYSTLTLEECKHDDNRLAWDVVPGVWEVKNR